MFLSKRLKSTGMAQKLGSWIPYRLKSTGIEKRFFSCELLLQQQRMKGLLHRVITGDDYKMWQRS